jgi:hypothetical protein
MPATAKNNPHKVERFFGRPQSDGQGPRELNGDGQTKGHGFDGVVK